ncbi:MFS transporter [Kitasatospora purpeofusca]|uniref:MFS transporter n=1 Tax=Kitasatospora purpeofusca TaxID=67352 RepID=UPI00068ABF1B|nr:MFS transporter [Kitasatospora purpeofusca]
MSTPPTDQAAPPGPDPRRWLALVAVALSVLVISFDMTVLNVALPTLASQLQATTGQQQWIVDSYTVVFAAVMLPAGLIGDRFGRRFTLTLGLGLFGLASAVGMLADSPGTLIAARAAMGLAGALVMPMSMAVIPGLFPPAEQRRATAILAAALAVGTPLGPLIGGFLLQHFWWGAIFAINLPLVVIGITACTLLLPETRNPAAPRIDLPATLLGAGGLAALTYGIIESPERGWSDPLVLGTVGGALVALTALVLRSRRQQAPMLDLALLADGGFRWSTVAATLVSLVLFGAFFVLPLYFQSVLGADAFGTGLRLMPMMLGLMVAARLSDRLVARTGPRAVIVLGLALLAGALLIGSRTEVSDGYALAAVWLTLLGVGMGLSLITAQATALLTLPPARAGVGSGLLQTFRQVGGAIGVAVFGSLLADSYRGALDTGGLAAGAAERAGRSVVAADAVAAATGDPALAASAHGAYVHGMTVVLLVSGVIAVLSAVLVALRMPATEPARATAQQEPAAAGGAGAGSAAAGAAAPAGEPGEPGQAVVPATDHG